MGQKLGIQIFPWALKYINVNSISNFQYKTKPNCVSIFPIEFFALQSLCIGAVLKTKALQIPLFGYNAWDLGGVMPPILEESSLLRVNGDWSFWSWNFGSFDMVRIILGTLIFYRKKNGTVLCIQYIFEANKSGQNITHACIGKVSW